MLTLKFVKSCKFFKIYTAVLNLQLKNRNAKNLEYKDRFAYRVTFYNV